MCCQINVALQELTLQHLHGALIGTASSCKISCHQLCAGNEVALQTGRSLLVISFACHRNR